MVYNLLTLDYMYILSNVKGWEASDLAESLQPIPFTHTLHIDMRGKIPHNAES
jgi:hypothetical protein